MRLGAMFDRDRRPEELVAFARRAEASGLDEVWVVEDCFWTGGLTSAAAALVATERLRVGLGIAPAPLRNVALLAMEIANLARIAPGRFTAGVGHGVQGWMEQVGARAASPLTLLDETISALRALLRGERVLSEGRYVTLRDVQLVHAPEIVPPVISGVVQPKSLALSGRVADGTLLCEGITAARLPETRAHIDRGRSEAGRTDHHQIVVFAYVAVDDDPLRAYERARPAIAHVAGNQHVPATDDMVIHGTAEMAAAAVRRWAAAGVDALALRPLGDDPDGQLAAVLTALGRTA